VSANFLQIPKTNNVPKDLMKVSGSTQYSRNAVVIISGLVAIILFWRGIWETSAMFMSAEVSLLLGAGLLAVIALVERKRFWRLLS
jgi:hypothetical protein